MTTQLAPLVETARAQLRGDPGAGRQATLRQIEEQIVQGGGIRALCTCEGCGVPATYRPARLCRLPPSAVLQVGCCYVMGGSSQGPARAEWVAET